MPAQRLVPTFYRRHLSKYYFFHIFHIGNYFCYCFDNYSLIMHKSSHICLLYPQHGTQVDSAHDDDDSGINHACSITNHADNLFTSNDKSPYLKCCLLIFSGIY